MSHTEVVKKIKTLILFSVNLFSKNRAIDDIIWKNIVGLDRSQMTVWSVRIVRWIHRATNTHFWNV